MNIMRMLCKWNPELLYRNTFAWGKGVGNRSEIMGKKIDENAREY